MTLSLKETLLEGSTLCGCLFMRVGSQLIMESWLNRLPNLEVVLVKADNAITMDDLVVCCGDTIEAIKVFKEGDHRYKYQNIMDVDQSLISTTSLSDVRFKSINWISFFFQHKTS